MKKIDKESQALGMDREITRRDFLNATALGAGASLLASAAPLAPWVPINPAGKCP